MYRQKRKNRKPPPVTIINHKRGKTSETSVDFGELISVNKEHNLSWTQPRIHANIVNNEYANVELPSAPDDKQRPRENYYYRYKQKELSAWQDQRQSIVQTLFEREAPLLPSSLCCNCNQLCVEQTKCEDCGPLYVSCKSCAAADHVFRPFHRLRIWKV